MASARTNFRKSTQKDLQQKAGRFYERLLARTLHCKRSPRGKPEWADLYSERLDARIEVKARGDSYGLGLRMEQAERLRLPQPFPIPAHVLYALVPYRSRRRIKVDEKRPRGIGKKTTMVSLFRGLGSDIEFNRCWAANTPVVYLLDLGIVNAIAKKNGTRLGFYPDRPDEEVLLINRKQLSKLFRDEDLSDSLGTLGLRSEKWHKGVHPMKIRIRVSDPRSALPRQFEECAFTLVTVLPRRLHLRVLRSMARKALTPK